MKRRNFLAGSITIPALSAGIPAAAVVRDPHPQWLDQWRKARQRWLELEDETAEAEAAWSRYMDFADRLKDEPVQTREGMAAKLEWIAAEYGDCLADMVGDQIRDTLASLVADAKVIAL